MPWQTDVLETDGNIVQQMLRVLSLETIMSQLRLESCSEKNKQQAYSQGHLQCYLQNLLQFTFSQYWDAANLIL